MSSDSRAAKRPRQCGSNSGGGALLSLYQSDLGEKILSFASGVDLCTLDALNKQFKSLTNEQWKVVTKDRFGMNNGKEGWKVGTSFLRPPVFVHNVADYGEGDYANPKVAANESVVADISESEDGMEIRDASSLESIYTIYSPILNSEVSICGRVGSEIFVTSNNKQIYAQQVQHLKGNAVQRWSYNNTNLDSLKTIGCETHLIVATNGHIKVYEITPVETRRDITLQSYHYIHNNTELFILRKDIRVNEGAGINDDLDIEECIAWGPDYTHFIVGYPHKICVWKFDADNNEITLTKTIDVPNWEVTNVALAEDYIVASSERKMVYIWNRNTGEKVLRQLFRGVEVDALYDVSPGNELNFADDQFVWPISLSCHGRILVSTSHIGCALCVWDMKTGELLKRHNEAEGEGVDMLPVNADSDVTDMVYLNRLNAFLCMGEYQNLWSFPINQTQRDAATNLRFGRDSESESES